MSPTSPPRIDRRPHVLRAASALLSAATLLVAGAISSAAQTTPPSPTIDGAAPTLGAAAPAAGAAGPRAAASAPTPAPGARTPTPVPPSPTWPTGDELRRDLQALGFTFRVDPATGDWLGWAPATEPRQSIHHIDLGGAGSAAARASFDFDLLQLEASSEAVSATLTALYEVTARLPVEPTSAELARRFIIGDLFTLAPAELERCYLDETSSGVILVLVGEATETGSAPATVRIARSVDGLDPDGTPDGEDLPDLESCAQLIPEEEAAALEPRSERITISMSGGEEPGFEPADVSVEGTLVTLILTFRNQSEVEQTLTFEPPLTSGTGPVAPGEERLIVVRQLEPGEYPFYSEADPEAIRGTVTIEPPALEAG